jgi:PAS domain S-box-containing protein
VVAFAEVVALLWANGKESAAVQLQQCWNELPKLHCFSLRCAYPMTASNSREHSQAFLEIRRAHSQVFPEGTYPAAGSEQDRLRKVAFLQQKAQGHESQAAERKEAPRKLRRREAELADFLENALEGAQQTGPDRTILWANRALLSLLGYTAAEYVGHDLRDFFDDRAAFDRFWNALTAGEEIYNCAVELKCHNGSVKHVLIHSNALWEEGRLVHTRTFIHDITEHKEMEQALQQAKNELEARVLQRTAELERKNVQILRQAETLNMANEGLRDLSARLLRVQDDERRRIARDLHDSTGQALALLSMNLSVLETEASRQSPELAKGLAESGQLVRQVSAELRTLSYLLHPPLLDEMGLESALRWFIDGFSERSGIQVTLELSADLGRLSRDMEIAVFRVVQECLTNVHRHSESPIATIRIYRSSGEVRLQVTDEGKGIAPEKLLQIESSGVPGLGLRGMRERVADLGGKLEVVSREKGTEINVVIPCVAPTQGA